MMAGLNEGRSYRKQLFDEIFDFSEDDSLFAEDMEEDESACDQDMNEGGIGAIANTNAIEESPLIGMQFPCISTMFNFYKEHARLKGCSLISLEDVNTFKWLFMTWLEAMGIVHPNSILIDQCESMRKAIREVGLHNSQTPGSQTQSNVTDAAINPIVSGTIPSHHSIH
ncbi:hypothetical protein GH714_010059 [Hevea brasiliensis]|uniref:MULE transposase domain-containing protein n=1 Tax=Hevea brasiliensis TaxID=3981 RepID=A0A6A6L280_HEVBR|nr:hypothetical protein GH714_010059 [Hevea brasiliensis]